MRPRAEFEKKLRAQVVREERELEPLAVRFLSSLILPRGDKTSLARRVLASRRPEMAISAIHVYYFGRDGGLDSN